MTVPSNATECQQNRSDGLASIVMADSTRAFDKPYTYRVPAGLSPRPGMRVLVPFGAKNDLREGWVLSTDEPVPTGKGIRLKTISSQVDEAPLLSADLLKLAGWMRERFFCTWHQALSTMLPSGARLTQQADGSFARRDAGKTRRAFSSLLTRDQVETMVSEGGIRSLHHIHVLEALLEEDCCPVDELYLIPGVSPNVLLTMKKKGWISESRLEAERDPFAALTVERRPAPEATVEQDAAFSRLAPLLSSNEPGFPEALVFGVTGSGKTELYLRLIEAALSQGKGAIMLVPEISLTPQTVERFLARFGSRVAVLHSRLSIGERYDQWRRIRKGELDVVVGARSAIFAPLERLGLVLVDEEHEGAYKSESSPRYDARLVARARCNLTGALLVYGSATPSIETFYRAEQGKIVRVDLHQRVAGRPLPQVTLVDMREELANGNRSHVSRLLESELRKNREENEQAILFLNRRGMAAFELCRDCGQVLTCPNCSVSLVLHRQNRLICHHCGHLEPARQVCPHCGGTRLEAIGVGTQRLEEDLGSHTHGYRVIRMDLDTTSGKEGHRRLLDEFRKGEADILVGTQMVAKGHDFPNVTLVGILSADGMLANGDWRASERTFQLLAQAAGRAGRADKPGRVVVQAFHVDDYSLQAVLAHDYEGFYRQEIAMRRKLQLPPFCHVGFGLITAGSAEQAEEANRVVGAWLRQHAAPLPGLLLAEGMPAPIPVLNGRHRVRVLLRHLSVRLLQDVLSRLLDACRKPLAALDADLSVDIDPGSVL